MSISEEEVIFDVTFDLAQLALNNGHLDLCEDLLSVAMNHDGRDARQDVYMNVFSTLAEQFQQVNVTSMDLFAARAAAND
ncbi:hypothetical protein [Lentibacter sp.]|uniref:hypothetical protein n=1 Tax=Lentibacter sp. TaxID=2024994 RepID=UPI003F6A7F49